MGEVAVRPGSPWPGPGVVLSGCNRSRAPLAFQGPALGAELQGPGEGQWLSLPPPAFRADGPPSPRPVGHWLRACRLRPLPSADRPQRRQTWT